MTKSKTKKAEAKVLKAIQNLTVKPKSKKKKTKSLQLVVKGKGDYYLGNQLIREQGQSQAPMSTGRRIGSSIGGFLGDAAESALRTFVSGAGDYTITANTLMPEVATSGPSPPEFSKSGKRGVRIQQREYITDIISYSTANTFNCQAFRLNPADPTTFPWLSSVASQFEEYQINGMVFTFKSTSSEFNGSGQALGTVIMATDYDVVDQKALNKLQMENMDYANSCKSAESTMHGIECKRGETAFPTLYTSAYTPSKGDQKTYDLGLFQVASYGVNGTSVNLGELWVSYDVTFYKKQVSGGQVGTTIPVANIVADNSSLTTALWLGNNPQVLGTLPMTVNGLVFSFPPSLTAGYYFVEIFNSYATSIAYPANMTSATFNCAFGTYWDSLRLVQVAGKPGSGITDSNTWPWTTTANGGWYGTGASGTMSVTNYVKITGPNASFTLNALTTVTGGYNAAFVKVTQVPNPELITVAFVTN